MPVKKYGVIKKAIALIIQMVCTAVLAVSIFILFSTFDKSMFKDGRLTEVDYFATENFQNDLTNELKGLFNYIQLRNSFETGGNYNLDKIVDIRDYMESGIITGIDDSGVSYTVRDLIEWGKMGIKREAVSIRDRSGRVTELDNAIKEEFYTVSGESLVTLYRRGTIDSLESFMQFQEDLEKTIKDLPEEVLNYKQQTTKYKNENTNLRYLVVCNSSLYTNVKLTDGKTTLEDIGKDIMSGSVFMHIESKPLLFESSHMDIQAEMYRSIDALKSFNNSDYSIYVSVDTSLPAADSLKSAHATYEKLHSWFWTCLVTGIASLIGFIITITYLTLITGYRDSNKKVYLNAFDGLYTEVAIAILVLAIVLIRYEVDRVYSASVAKTGTFYNVMLLGAVSFVLDALVLSGYLSIIRRNRAGTLYTNSLLYATTTPVKTAIGTKAITLRTGVLYILTMAAFTGLAYLAFGKQLQIAGIVFVFFIIIVGTFLIRESFLRKRVIDGAAKIADGDLDFKIDTNGLKSDNLLIAEIINTAGEGISKSLEDQIKSEKLKADLITNVSHDIKTPLTSIINYVDLIKREDIKDPKIQSYIAVLEEKSQRLKHLTEDLVEASKISSGNIEIVLTDIDFKELVSQTEGEFIDKFEGKNLELCTNVPEGSVHIIADGMRIWRVIENLYNNVAKYALANTRVYVDLSVSEDMAELSIKNISSQALNISAEELTERFIQGDISRSTEGSGLGLSIARNLTTLQGGEFNIYLDGDLFKVTVAFPLVTEEFKQENGRITEDNNDQTV
ncbi:MAG: HAMP domain-containing histidine kinase [Lachnospiraceae bacterium]|nr:HAMP domain-containing histidine kinase [Lachnospiraceae bacterium]